MSTNKLENGFYWIRAEDDADSVDDIEVAELSNGEWYLTGTNATRPQHDRNITVLSKKLTPKNLFKQ